MNLQWQSGYEARNLGYYVYREQNGTRTRITPSLVAGSALLAGRQTTFTAGASYTWYDRASAESHGPVTYWLEDVDLNGQRTLHGPITSSIRRSSLNKEERQQRSALLEEVQPGNSTGVFINSYPATQPGKQFGLKAMSAGAYTDVNAQQRNIAGTPGVKLSISRAGWYRVSQPELVAAGLDPNAAANNLQLFANGREVPVKLSSAGAQLTSSDYLEFFAPGLDSPTDASQTFYLISGSAAGKRIGIAADSGVVPGSAQSFEYTVERKDRWLYFPGLLNGEAENIFGHVVTGTPVSETVPVSHLDAGAAAAGSQAKLEISLQGVSLQDHHVHVLLNGADVGTIDFAGTDHPVQSFTIPSSAIREGDNTVELAALGGATDISLVDTLRVTYAHSYLADTNALAFSVNSAATTRVGGFTSANVRGVDITDVGGVQELSVSVSTQPDGTFAADLRVPNASSNEPHTLLVFADSQAGHPDSVRHNDASAWGSNTNRADYLIITSRDFTASAQRLAQYRRSQGMIVNVIDIEDLYDEFSFGMHSPQALRDFLGLAASAWSRRPHFVLLMGDASYDPKNYLGQGNTDFVPSKLFDSALLETASDDWLADFNGDGLSDLAIGRLPVRTSADADLMVNKIMDYENAPADPQRGALLVADTDFEQASAVLQGLLPATMPNQVINRVSGDDATIHNQIISGINQGPRVVNYLGHGSNQVWTGAGLLSNADAANMTNGNRLPVFIMMTCLNGLFHNAYGDSLAEALLRAPGGGAVAVWASTGMTEPGGQSLINQEFYRQVYGPQPRTLGDAVRAAKAATADLDIRRTWTLFGDPAMRLSSASPTASNGSVGGTITDSQGAPLAGTTINLSGARTRQTITDGNGTYSFDNLDVNGFYTVTPSRANYSFSPASRNFSTLGEHTDAAFTGIPDGGTSTNAIDSTEFFVRQQYLDFLGREPDESGFNFWTDQVRSCGNDATCLEARRINTSAAFFLSIEFQQTGYLVYRTYKSAYGNMPDAPVPVRLNEFLPDTQEIGQGVVVNQAGWEALLENNKQAFMTEFVHRARFSSAYPTTMTPAEFVDQLFANAGVTPSGPDRAGAISEFGSAATTGDVAARARALRRVGENSTLAQRELNRAFVLMQYFGYLRRNPNEAPEASLDYSGYNFWLNKLNSFNGNFVNAEMVKAFLISGEYRQRFAR